MYGILGRYDYPVKKIKRNADRKQSAKTHQGYGVFWQADVFSREEPCYENKNRSQDLNLDNKCFQQL